MLSDLELIRLRRAQEVLRDADRAKEENFFSGWRAVFQGGQDEERVRLVIKRLNLKIEARALIESDRMLTGRHRHYGN